MSAVSYVTGLWQRCVAAARSIGGPDGASAMRSADGFGVTRGIADGDAGGPTLLVYAQALWMAATLTVLFALTLLSLRLYFVVSFIGLLVNRLLFAPRTRAERWWRVANAITWLCFAVLTYILYRRVELAMAVSGSA